MFQRENADGLQQGLANYDLQAGPRLIFVNYVYWDTATLLHFCTVYGSFYATKADLNRCNTDCMAYREKSLKYLLSGALMESQPTPGLEQKQG